MPSLLLGEWWIQAESDKAKANVQFQQRYYIHIPLQRVWSSLTKQPNVSGFLLFMNIQERAFPSLCLRRQPCFPGGSEVKALAWNVGDPGLIPGTGRSLGEGTGNPLQYSCLENPIDGGAWQATVHGVAKSCTGFTDKPIPSPSHSPVYGWSVLQQSQETDTKRGQS